MTPVTKDCPDFAGWLGVCAAVSAHSVNIRKSNALLSGASWSVSNKGAQHNLQTSVGTKWLRKREEEHKDRQVHTQKGSHTKGTHTKKVHAQTHRP